MKHFFLDHINKKIENRNDAFMAEIYRDHQSDLISFEFSSEAAFDVFPLDTLITKEELDLLKREELSLFLVNTHEAFHFPIYKVYKEVIALGIPIPCVYYCSESADVKRISDWYAKKFNVLPLKTIWTRRFEHDIGLAAKSLYGVERELNTLQIKDYEKKFLFFNRRWRKHRPLAVALLKLENLLDRGYVSLAKSDDKRGWVHFWQGIERDSEVADHIKEYLKVNKHIIDTIPELYVDTDELVTNQAHLDTSADRFYNDTYFSVVSETNFFTGLKNNAGVFLSEKIFKPIAQQHPFVVFGPPGTLKKLKDLGYKTFGRHWDESYDFETNDIERMRKIIAVIKKLSNMPKRDMKNFLVETKKICEYNYYQLMAKHKFYTVMDDLPAYEHKLDRHQYYKNDNIVTQIIEAGKKDYQKIILDNSVESMVGRFTTTDTIMKDSYLRLIYPELYRISNIIEKFDNEKIKFEYLTGSCNEKEVYKEFCRVSKRNPKNLNVKYKSLYDIKVSGWINSINNTKLQTKKYDIKRKFLFYNRNPHEHRLIMVALLLEAGLLDQGFVSLYTNLHPNENLLGTLDNVQISDDLKKRVTSVYNDNLNLFPMKLSLNDNADNPISLSKEDYIAHRETNFSLISETEFFKKHPQIICGDVFFTEKTYKAIACKHPFIIMGAKNSLKCLRDLGYKTFPNIFNESYDTISNDEERLLAIQREMIRVCSLTQEQWLQHSEEIEEITTYNYSIMMQKVYLRD